MSNIQNHNEKCFLWCILASLHPVQRRNHLDRVSKYQEYERELNMSGIQYPVDVKDIGKFEHQNNISVNAYALFHRHRNPLPPNTRITYHVGAVST